MPQNTIATPTCQKLESTESSARSLCLPRCVLGHSTRMNGVRVRMFAKTVCLIYAVVLQIVQLYTKQGSGSRATGEIVIR